MATPETALGAPAPGTARYGEVYDRGYQHYDGPRLGRRHAFGALIRYSIKRALGIKKSWTAKIIPILLYVAVAIPVIVSVGIEAFFPQGTPISYPDLFGLIFSIEGVFVATIAPEMLCGDRRENVLALYFSRAISRLDYLLAKLAATATLTLTISLAPAAIYWLFLQLLADRPLSALGDNIDDLGRVCLAGAMIALYLGALGLTVSSFTGRKSIAVAVIVIGFGVATALAYALANAVTDEGLDRYLVFLSPLDTVDLMTSQLFGTGVGNVEFGELLPLWQYVAGMGLVVLACIGVMAWRYVPED